MRQVGRAACAVVLLLICVVPALGNGDLTDEARQVALDFWKGKKVLRTRASAGLQLLRKVGDGYVFVPADGVGYVCVAGGDEPVVCAYSLTGAVGTEVPSFLMGMMQNQVGATADVSVLPVEPLLTSVWHQDSPFNGLCPYYMYADSTVSTVRCRVGCVATAASEVVRYYAYPEALCDTLHGWSTAHYTLDTVLPGARLDYADMLDDYDGDYTDAEALAVQELALYCGMACHMSYGVSASGSYISRLEVPLGDVFGYNYVELFDRARYSPSAWRAMLQYQLERGVPLVYSGYNMELAGHAFVIDGMDDEGFYHARWGEGGVYDGYFDIDFLNPYEAADDPTDLGRQMGHFCNQAALAFYPDALGVVPTDTLTYRADEIEVLSVDFLRAPDTNGYVTADVALYNHSADTITYTLLAFTTDSCGVEDWSRVEAVGMTAVTLYPSETSSVQVHCEFAEADTLFFGLTGDEDYVLYLDSVVVEQGGDYELLIGPVDVLELDAEHVTFEVNVTNDSDDGWVGDMLIYTFLEDGVERDAAHYRLLNLAPGETAQDTVTFNGLEPETGYTFCIRYPWEFVYTYDFITPTADCVGLVADDAESNAYHIYSLTGICVATGLSDEAEADALLKRLPKGIYIVRSSDGVCKKLNNF